MLFNLLAPLGDDIGFFNLFRFLTFRTGGAVMTAMVLSFLLGPPLIRWLRNIQRTGQPIRDDGPSSHLISKKGTPTMGGFLILLSFGVSTLLWADLTNGFVWAALLVTLGFGAVGFVDDYLKVTRESHRGVPGRVKILAEILIALVATVWIMALMGEPLDTGLAVPFFKDVLLNLWFNAPPASVFMGDTGSLSMGGALGVVAVVTKHELVLGVIGGLFVLETASVIVQVASFKLTGRRVFRMAPLHHHYEEKGWAEPTIVIRFWIIAVILALIGLSTLKLR
jgi:phospho-N-acetylmuramoyl-pentapeptide-transferase